MSKPLQSVVARAERHRNRPAIVDREGEFTYADLLDSSARVAASLLDGHDDLREQRVAFLVTPGFSWVAVLWGIWRVGGIAVPLPAGSPVPELEYFLDDTGATVVVFDTESANLLAPLAAARHLRARSSEHICGAPHLPGLGSCGSSAESSDGAPHLPAFGRWGSRRAMIIYTSGTTSRPKGVVSTHHNITAQITTLVNAWEWSPDDRILLCLPLHHVHGIINVVSCALGSGATCDMLSRFDADAVWDHIAGGRLTLFMAVPTIYVKLIAAWESYPPERRVALSRACAQMRLMVSGSAALPVTTLERWKQITGHMLLERYGMTEIGMALSNPLHGRRVPGSVGVPLPGVTVRLVDEAGMEVAPGTPGEIEVRSASVFREYWNKPEATQQAFRDGWFRTGDMAVVKDGVYRILGRASVDIIKTGGHKVSALEIEEVLRQHEAVAECAVVGLPDAEWGERVAAAIVLRPENTLDLAALRGWAKERLAAHKVPSRLLTLDALPRNAMGKVTKPAVAALFKAAQPCTPDT